MPHPAARIDLRIRSFAQLFDSMDPSPFREKALDDKAARWLLDSVREHPRDAPLQVVVHLPESLRIAAHNLPDAIHNHFRFELGQARRELRWRMGSGWRALGVGLALLAGCVLLGTLISAQFGDSAHAGLRIIDEGLLILGWVALWRPLDILLFDRFELRAGLRLIERLVDVPVELRFAED
ncbi:MAG TPA: hypothetical protein VN581_12070 [Patescibacteria group bacterium]|nr:hypothetical protein [Patescibacteria group bacterium]